MTTKLMIASQLSEAKTAERPVRFTNTLASEWAKMFSLRSTMITLGLGVILSIGTTAIATLAISSTQDTWPDELDGNLFWLIGNIFSLIIFSVFGVLAATREYSSGMIRLTLAATPARSRVLAAKFLLVGLVVTAAGLMATVGMFLASQAIRDLYGMPVIDMGSSDVQRTIVGMGLVMAFFPVLGLALGILFRSAAAGITTVLGVLWLPLILSEMMPTWWSENVISLLPGSAVDSFTIGHVVDSPAYVDPLAGVAIASAWLLLVVGSAFVVFNRRDA